MQKIKSQLNKGQNEFLTIEEFCLSTGIKPDQISHLIIG
jgi:hypothetical protein